MQEALGLPPPRRHHTPSRIADQDSELESLRPDAIPETTSFVELLNACGGVGQFRVGLFYPTLANTEQPMLTATAAFKN